ncbi:peptidase [Agaricicola taiwanensis]|uniref:Peptidase n=1 Tax=Agaricicola taiwanensis TaxID=591372 RepID=A0A8J2W204_9RHOB|nr:peptidase [Agaricicola taiwanensis]GGE42049.1 peptidase [Agaricicola taiwanensis]
MTYCVGILVRDGLVMVADTRTNAGVDNIATFRKLHHFQGPDRFISLAASGNLSITQSVLTLIVDGLEDPASGRSETIYNQSSLFKVAQLIGRAVREVWRVDGPGLEEQGAFFDVQMMLGGQVGNGPMRLFQIYSAGNFIEVAQETIFFQIGEHKYGKPILDRAMNFDTDPLDALKIALISMDSTMRSNLSVGMPLDILFLRRGSIVPDIKYRIDPGEPYFHDLRERWSAALRAAHMAIPKPPYRVN